MLDIRLIYRNRPCFPSMEQSSTAKNTALLPSCARIREGEKRSRTLRRATLSWCGQNRSMESLSGPSLCIRFFILSRINQPEICGARLTETGHLQSILEFLSASGSLEVEAADLPFGLGERRADAQCGSEKPNRRRAGSAGITVGHRPLPWSCS
jgi:hypothetical protein